MGNVLPQNKWEAKIEWLDNNHYLKLNENDKKKLLRFRSLHSYINKLSKSIEEREDKIKKLKSEVLEKEKGKKKYLNEGKALYQFLEKLKSDLELKVYYTEGKHNKMIKKDRFKTIKTEKKSYQQCLLKFKTANNKRLYSISLGPKRSTFLNEIKKIDPKWYNENGKFLNVEVHSDMNKVRIEITKYFKPYIEKLFKINYQRIKEKNYSLTKNKIYDEIAKSVK